MMDPCTSTSSRSRPRPRPGRCSCWGPRSAPRRAPCGAGWRCCSRPGSRSSASTCRVTATSRRPAPFDLDDLADAVVAAARPTVPARSTTPATPSGARSASPRARAPGSLLSCNAGLHRRDDRYACRLAGTRAPRPPGRHGAPGRALREAVVRPRLPGPRTPSGRRRPAGRPGPHRRRELRADLRGPRGATTCGSSWRRIRVPLTLVGGTYDVPTPVGGLRLIENSRTRVAAGRARGRPPGPGGVPRRGRRADRHHRRRRRRAAGRRDGRPPGGARRPLGRPRAGLDHRRHP